MKIFDFLKKKFGGEHAHEAEPVVEKPKPTNVVQTTASVINHNEPCPLARTDDGRCIFAHCAHNGNHYCFLTGNARNVTNENIVCPYVAQRLKGCKARRAAIKAEEELRRRFDAERRKGRDRRGGFRQRDAHALTEGVSGTEFA